MNLLANYCELEPQPVRKGMKRVKLPKGHKETGVNEYKEMLFNAKTVGDVVKALRKAAYGKHSDMPPELWEKLEKASKCKEKV